jgi:putative spermidine/putrescine transport system permease protein
VKLRRIVLWAFCLLVVCYLIAPSLTVVPVSFNAKPSFLFPPESWSTRWYQQLWENPLWAAALRQTLIVASLSSLLAAAVGALAAFGLARLKSTAIRSIVRGALVSPMLVPEIILAVGIYSAFLQLGLIGSTTGLVIAHAAIGAPMVLITVTSSLATVDSQLELAAASLGAGPVVTMRDVTIPLVLPGLLAGTLFSFVLSLDNVLVSLLLSTPGMITLPVQMWASMTRDTDPTIAAAATAVLLFTLILIGAALYILTWRAGRTLKGTES